MSGWRDSINNYGYSMEPTLYLLPRIFLAIVALAFIGFGILGWVNPAGTVAPLDLTVNTAQAKTEIRATYGGLLVGIGLFIAIAALYPTMVRFGLILVVVMLFTIGFTRLYGIAVDGTRVSMQWQLLATELIPAIIGLLLIIFYKFDKV